MTKSSRRKTAIRARQQQRAHAARRLVTKPTPGGEVFIIPAFTDNAARESGPAPPPSPPTPHGAGPHLETK